MTDLSTEEVIAGLKWIKSGAVDGYNMTKGQALDVLFAAITALEGMVWRPIEELNGVRDADILIAGGKYRFNLAGMNDDWRAAVPGKIYMAMFSAGAGRIVSSGMECSPTHFIPLSALPKPKDKA